MIQHPFAILKPYQDSVHAVLITKEDDSPTEDDIATRTGAANFAALHQVHGNKTVIVREATDRTIQADGMITDQSSLLLTIRIADCQPMLIFAPEKKVLGLLHVGWKGLQAGAIAQYFRVLQDTFDISAKETLVCIGPSLCQKCAEFTDPKTELSSVDPKFFFGRHVDLQGAADDLLQKCGVLPSKIERIAKCTCCDTKTFWSYRGGDKEDVKAGCGNMLACTLC